MTQILFNLIQDDHALKQSIARISTQKPNFVAIDTEFTRRTTYWPGLELIQIGVPNSPILVIDCKNITDWSPLVLLLKDVAIVKVFHSARQDLEGFLKLFNTLPTPLFDLQIAAAFMGFGHSIGLGDFVEQLLGETPNKSEQHSNWQDRPLRPSQISYAAMDAYYLTKLYPLVIEQLELLGRSSWILEFCELLEHPSRLITNPEHTWVKLRSHFKNEIELFFCQEFSKLREKLAQDADYNRTRVISDNDLIELSQKMALYVKEQNNPTHDGTLLSADLPIPSLDKISPEFLETFTKAQHSSIARFRTIGNFRQLRSHLRHGLGTLFNGTQQKRLFDAKIRLNSEANRLVIPMHYLAPNSMLESYILSPNDDHPLISGWREQFTKSILTEVFTKEIPKE